MKFFNSVVNFSYSWREVAAGLFQRYPNPFRLHGKEEGGLRLHVLFESIPCFWDNKFKHVLTEDVLERYVNEDGKLHTVKLLTKTNPLPRWGERFYRGPKFITIIEESVVDPSTQTFTTYTRNISMVHFMSCTEKCVYKSNPEGNETSTIQKSAWLESSLGYGLRLPVLEFSIKRYKSNQHKATLGLEYAISHRLPPTLRDRVRQRTERFAESAKHSKEILSQGARKASEIAMSKAERAKSKATVKASET